MTILLNERDSLIIYLQKLKENKFKVSNHNDLKNYSTLMLKYIGDKDPVLRDDLIYIAFNKWISKFKYFSEEELLNILSISLDKEHLFFKIGNTQDDSVFTRSFSVLIVCLILERHRERPFLSESLFIDVKNALLEYYAKENDLRGYVENYGWAHSAAHGADGFFEIVLSKECDEELCISIMDSIKNKLFNGYYIFHDEEDERMVDVVNMIYTRKLISRERFETWLLFLVKCLSEFTEFKKYICRVNIKNFMRSLYFKTRNLEYDEELVDYIFNLAKEI